MDILKVFVYFESKASKLNIIIHEVDGKELFALYEGPEFDGAEEWIIETIYDNGVNLVGKHTGKQLFIEYGNILFVKSKDDFANFEIN